MKKQLAVLFSLTVLCLFMPTLGASQTAVSEVINGNTYIYPNGKGILSTNELIIIKPYTENQIREAEEALEPAFKSFYLSKDTALCDAIATYEFNRNCEYRSWTPDFSSLYAFSAFSVDMPPFSEEKTVSEAISAPSDTRFNIMMKNDQGVNVGSQFIVIQDGAYHVMGCGDFGSAYITYDLRTHAVALYAMLKDSGLNLKKTTAKLFMCETGQYYLFSDGNLEFVTPIGMQPEFSPYTTGAGYPDASSSFQLIKGKDYIKAMTKASEEIKSSRSSSDNYSGLSSANADNAVSQSASSRQQITLPQTVSGDIEVINGNTYIYPNGYPDTPNSDIIINKSYTDEQLRQAEEALEPIFKSFYLSDDKTLCENIINAADFQNVCKYENWVPDLSTLCAMSGYNNIAAFPTTGTVSEALNQSPEIYYRMLTKSTNGGYGGDLFIHDDYTFGYGLFTSAYITEDLRTHAVDLYALLKDSGLDFTETTAKFFQIGDVGRFLLFSDGSTEFVTPIGLQLDYSPYKVSEGYPDASASFQPVRGEDFIKAMAQTAKDYNAAMVPFSADNPQMGGITETDGSAPSGNMILYIAIVCFAIAAVSAVVYLVIRKKRLKKI